MQKKISFVITCFLLSATVFAQASRRPEYGANLNFAMYQFDPVRSQETRNMMTLKQTASTAEEEIEYLTRNFGLDDVKLRHVRAVGLRAGESYTDTQHMNEKQLLVTIKPSAVTRDAVRFDITAKFDDKPLLELKDVSVDNYGTVALRGGQGVFGVREFAGPNGPETVPEERALLITVTATIIDVRGLKNKPSDLSRPCNEFGVAVQLQESDVFVMPSVVTRTMPKFVTSSLPKGAVVLEAVITPDGRVTNIKVLETPDSAFNTKFIEAFRQYHFNPAQINGKPAYATYRETFLFRN
ncbi:MAG TPA: energy transducer TonB [Blastocatellia bacterium]|nr:energy transducer TonB [Blastocatellia bacterium]